MIYMINESNPLNLIENLDILNIEDEINFDSINIKNIDETYNIINYNDIKKLSEEYFITNEKAVLELSEINNINPNSVIISFNEEQIIENPNIINDINLNFVIKPIALDDPVRLFCESYISLYEETFDEIFLEALLEGTWEENPELQNQVKQHAQQQIEKLSNELSNAQTDVERDHIIGRIKSIQHNLSTAGNRINNISDEISKNPNISNPVDDGHKWSMPTNTGPSQKRIMGLSLQRGTGGRIYNSISRTVDSGEKKIKQGADWVRSNPKYAAGIGLGAAALAGGAYAYKKHKDKIAQEEAIEKRLMEMRRMAENKPKSWLAKKIAALRGIYKQYLEKARMQVNAGTAGIFKKIASKILGCIDYLMEKLQNAVN